MLHISIIQEQLLGILSMDNAKRRLIKEQSLKKRYAAILCDGGTSINTMIN